MPHEMGKSRNILSTIELLVSISACMCLLVFKNYIITAYPLNLMSHCLFYFVCIFTILSSIFGSDSSYTHVYIHTYTHSRGHELHKVGFGFVQYVRYYGIVLRSVTV